MNKVYRVVVWDDRDFVEVQHDGAFGGKEQRIPVVHTGIQRGLEVALNVIRSQGDRPLAPFFMGGGGLASFHVFGVVTEPLVGEAEEALLKAVAGLEIPPAAVPGPGGTCDSAVDVRPR